MKGLSEMAPLSRASLLSEMARFLEASQERISFEELSAITRLAQNDDYSELSGLSTEDASFFGSLLKRHVRMSGCRPFDGQLPGKIPEAIQSHFPDLARLYDLYQSTEFAFEYIPNESEPPNKGEAIYEIYERYAAMPFEGIAKVYQKSFDEVIADSYQFLQEVTAFERFVHTKFTGQKRFSIEGSESALYALYLLKQLYFQEQKSLVIGMSHRGRLAAMATLFSKPLSLLFLEFMGEDENIDESGNAPQLGDVKYHKGYTHSSSENGPHIVLLPNASHLESIYPIALGYTKGKQELDGTDAWAPVIFHGDAAFTGQGVVYETLEMKDLNGFHVGGAIHVIIDNQVGFTATPEETRSTVRPTNIFGSFSIPIIHVKNDHPAFLLKAAVIAFQIRQQFSIDVAIRVLGTRKWGHNEGDDPTFTQPQLYKKTIASVNPAFEIFQSVTKLSDVTCNQISAQIQKKLYAEYSKAEEISTKKQKSKQSTSPQAPRLKRDYLSEDVFKNVQKALSLPVGFHIHPKVKAFFEKRQQLLQAHGIKALLDWSFAEFVAFSSIVSSGLKLRLVGQDVERGTFTHRHATVVDQETEEEWSPLSQLGDFEVFNSIVSEYGALGFEYGFSLALQDKGLVIWEAQFGDFANGAQIIIDQYLTAGYEKWGAKSNLVLLLPHGYEGQGPEHSSCRLERFLSLAANNNLTIAYPSRPSTYAQLLMRQSSAMSPLIVLTPKAMLRDSRAVSSFSECFDTKLSCVAIMNENSINPETVRVVLVSTGKFAYELVSFLEKERRADTAVISIEILYPFPESDLQAILHRFSHVTHIIWAQEEPVNMGALPYMRNCLMDLTRNIEGIKLSFIGRGESSSPATGYHALHDREQEKLLNQIHSLINE